MACDNARPETQIREHQIAGSLSLARWFEVQSLSI